MAALPLLASTIVLFPSFIAQHHNHCITTNPPYPSIHPSVHRRFTNTHHHYHVYRTIAHLESISTLYREPSESKYVTHHRLCSTNPKPTQLTSQPNRLCASCPPSSLTSQSICRHYCVLWNGCIVYCTDSIADSSYRWLQPVCGCIG
jgi:hypothetical protein